VKQAISFSPFNTLVNGRILNEHGKDENNNSNNPMHESNRNHNSTSLTWLSLFVASICHEQVVQEAAIASTAF